VPSVKVPVAVNCSFVPRGVDALAGVTEIAVRIADETVNCVCPDTLPDAAVTVTAPIPCEAAKPAPFTLAVLVFVDVHVTADVMFCVLPSE